MRTDRQRRGPRAAGSAGNGRCARVPAAGPIVAALMLLAGASAQAAGTPAGMGEGTGTLEEKWRTDLGRGMGRRIEIAGGRVFAATFDRRVGALDLATGERLWRIKRDSGVPGGVALRENRLLAVSDEPEGKLFCLDSENGDLLWERAVGAAVACPVVHEERVFVAALRGRLAACDLGSGEIIWQRPVGGQVRARPVAGGPRVIVATVTDSLVALASATGDFQWGASPGGAVYGQPLLEGEVLWTLSYEGVLSRWQAEDGLLLARARLPGPFRSGVIRGGDLLAAVSTGGRLVTVDPHTLAVRWQVELGGAADREPLHLSGSLWLSLRDGTLREVRLGDGVEVRRHRLDRLPMTGIASGGGTLVLGVDTGDLIALGFVSGDHGDLQRPAPRARPQAAAGGAGPHAPAMTPGGESGTLHLWHRGSLAADLGPGGASTDRAGTLASLPPSGGTIRADAGQRGPRLGTSGKLWGAGWVLGAGLAVWLQREADHAYDRYQETGAAQARADALQRAERYDRATLGSWIVSEICFVMMLRNWFGGRDD